MKYTDWDPNWIPGGKHSATQYSERHNNYSSYFLDGVGISMRRDDESPKEYDEWSFNLDRILVEYMILNSMHPKANIKIKL